MKSSTNYFHVKTKKLADFQICMSVPLTDRFYRHIQDHKFVKVLEKLTQILQAQFFVGK